MDPVTAFWHIGNFFAAPVGLGLVASALCKLLWRGALRGTSVLRLWAWTAGAGALVAVGGLLLLGQDGRMATDAAMVLVCSAVPWWFSRGGR